MFSTTIATNIYVPVQDRAKLYAFGCKSPRASRFGASIRQLVHHSGGPSPGSIPASLVVDDVVEPSASNEPGPKILESPHLADFIEEVTSK